MFRRPRTPRSLSMLDELLLDPDLMDDRTSDVSDRGDFGTRVTVRDHTCGSTYFDACHIVPHAKGHKV